MSTITPVEPVVVDVQIDVQLIERRGGHINHVHVAEPAAARLQHVLAIAIDPVAIQQALLRRLICRAHDDLARFAASGERHRQLHAAIDRVGQPFIQIGAHRHRLALNRRNRIAHANTARERCRPEWKH
jgi:hypothetical protein